MEKWNPESCAREAGYDEGYAAGRAELAKEIKDKWGAICKAHPYSLRKLCGLPEEAVLSARISDMCDWLNKRVRR